MGVNRLNPVQKATFSKNDPKMRTFQMSLLHVNNRKQ